MGPISFINLRGALSSHRHGPLKFFSPPSSSSSLTRTLATTIGVDRPNLQASPTEERKILNQDVRDSLRKLPTRRRRLDIKSVKDETYNEAEDVLIKSLDNGRQPIGSSYAKARSPVYFPNITLRLTRPSLTDRGDPYTAIFRCDLQLTKPDIFNYLRQIYGIGITSIRTAIYRGRYERKLKSKVRGGIKVARKKERTFKKVWVGLDRPFFYPSQPSTKFLDENYNFSDFLNSYNRSRLIQLERAKSDRMQVLPAGREDKGERVNVFRKVLDSKKTIQDELHSYVKKSLLESTNTPPKNTKDP